jgi:hypothetical protein
MSTFDPNLLLTTLRRELRQAWATLRAGHAAEGLYGFGVYTTDEASYLMVTAFSEAGLAATVKRYQEREHGRGKDPELLRASLRWSPCDSPLHEVGSTLLPESDELIQVLDPALAESPDDDEDDEDDEFDPRVLKVFELAIQALQEMDAEGLFGAGAERDALVLGLWKGDQSTGERYAYARQLNAIDVAQRFGAEMNAGVRAFYAANFADVDAPEDEVFD